MGCHEKWVRSYVIPMGWTTVTSHRQHNIKTTHKWNKWLQSSQYNTMVCLETLAPTIQTLLQSELQTTSPQSCTTPNSGIRSPSTILCPIRPQLQFRNDLRNNSPRIWLGLQNPQIPIESGTPRIQRNHRPNGSTGVTRQPKTFCSPYPDRAELFWGHDSSQYNIR